MGSMPSTKAGGSRPGVMLALAALLAAGIVGLALPRTLARRDRLIRLNGEIVGYQRAIGERQEQIRSLQTEILAVQNEIRRQEQAR